jgi:hypothetical protein
MGTAINQQPRGANRTIETERVSGGLEWNEYAERLTESRWNDANFGEKSDTKPGLGNQRKRTEIASVSAAWLSVWLSICSPECSGADALLGRTL